MAYLDSTFNAWINQQGKARPVSPGCHAADHKRGEYVRISTPESRRMALGISIDAKASRAARAEARRLCRIARTYGISIVASIDGHYVECFPADRPTELNRRIMGGANR